MSGEDAAAAGRRRREALAVRPLKPFGAGNPSDTFMALQAKQKQAHLTAYQRKRTAEAEKEKEAIEAIGYAKRVTRDAQAEAEAAAEIEAESEDDIVSGWCDSDDELAKDEENALLLRSLSLLENKPTAPYLQTRQGTHHQRQWVQHPQ